MWVSGGKILSHAIRTFRRKRQRPAPSNAPSPGVSGAQPAGRQGPGHPRSVGGTPVFTAGTALPRQAPAPAATGLGHLGGREASVNSRGKASGLQTQTLSKQALWLRAAGGQLGSRVRRNLLESYSVSLMIKETKRRATLRYQSPPVNRQVQNPMAAWEEMGRTRGAPNTSGASSGCDPTVLQS